jgi:hypothetical protein
MYGNGWHNTNSAYKKFMSTDAILRPPIAIGQLVVRGLNRAVETARHNINIIHKALSYVSDHKRGARAT